MLLYCEINCFHRNVVLCTRTSAQLQLTRNFSVAVYQHAHTLVLLEYYYGTHLHLLNALTHCTVWQYLHTSFIINQLTWHDLFHYDMAGGYNVTCCKTTHLFAKQNTVITLQVVDSVSAVMRIDIWPRDWCEVLSRDFVFVLQWALSSEQCKL